MDSKRTLSAASSTEAPPNSGGAFGVGSVAAELAWATGLAASVLDFVVELGRDTSPLD